jgi:hypothetical protein
VRCAMDSVGVEGRIWVRKQVRAPLSLMFRLGQNRIYTPCMTVYLVISLLKTPYIHCIYKVRANPTYVV